MNKSRYTKSEKDINSVLHMQAAEFDNIIPSDMSDADSLIEESEELLKSLGYEITTSEVPNAVANISKKKEIVIPSWDVLVEQSQNILHSSDCLEDLFTEDELHANEQAIKLLNSEYNQLHKLDKLDIAISASAALLSAAIDILLIGIPERSSTGLKSGKLADYIRDYFDKIYPAEEMEKLANSKVSKVPFDAQDNRHISEDSRVEGLSAYYHRLLSLGHDPLLGLIFGVYDILNGTMTTIDKNGVFRSQVMDVYADRTESSIAEAIAKQIIHFKSDITTSMGLPVPLMALFNLLQFGDIGQDEQTIAQIVQGMYYEGYDFIHFCSMSVPVMITEIFVRLCYALKRIKEGNPLKESIPFSLNREKHPKLATMLFIAHSGATSINAGKIYFSKNPMDINYPQWIAFGKYSFQQLKWILINKPECRRKYVDGILNEELSSVYAEIDETFKEITSNYRVVFE